MQARDQQRLPAVLEAAVGQVAAALTAAAGGYQVRGVQGCPLGGGGGRASLCRPAELSREFSVSKRNRGVLSSGRRRNRLEAEVRGSSAGLLLHAGSPRWAEGRCAEGTPADRDFWKLPASSLSFQLKTRSGMRYVPAMPVTVCCSAFAKLSPW